MTKTGVLNYRGDITKDVVGNVMGPTLEGVYMVCIDATYNPETDRTRAEMDELRLGENAQVQMVES